MKSGPFAVLAAAEIAISPSFVSYSEEPKPSGLFLWSYGRLGFLLDFQTLSIGLSAALRTLPFNQGFAVQLPMQMGAEVNILIPETYIEISIISFAEIAGADDYYVAIGGGIGVIH